MEEYSDAGYFVLLRDARLFVRRPELRSILKELKTSIDMAPHQIFKPRPDTDYVIRLGRLRLAEFLPDGREIARGVLQAGSCFLTRPESRYRDREGTKTAAILLMALGEIEIWSLPPGTLESHHVV